MVFFRLAPLIVCLWVVLNMAMPAQASDRQDIRDFLKVTGFDVAIASIRQGAMAGPALTGEDPEVFGRQWRRLAHEVFDPDHMIEDAVDMLEVVMPAALLAHGADFYGSDLGQRLVAVENDSHMTDEAEKYAVGEQIVTRLAEEKSVRLDVFHEMSRAIGSTENAVKTIVEIQLRYLMAAMAAGVSDYDVSEDELRLILMEQSGEIRRGIEVNTLVSNAYAYRDLSDDDLIDYLSALQEPKMGQVYEILNGVQYHIMADRYEILASRLNELSRQQEL